MTAAGTCRRRLSSGGVGEGATQALEDDREAEAPGVDDAGVRRQHRGDGGPEHDACGEVHCRRNLAGERSCHRPGPRLGQRLLWIGMLVPESGAAASLTRKSTMAATSSGVIPGLRCGAARRSRAVSTAPGLIATQRTPCSRPSSATASVSAITPAFETL